ncbi:MAG: glycosyltransferase family 2 protein [Flavipsychrobacter sp.]
MEGKVSICIPAYKRVDFLKRLLESILEQTYKNHEVVITDDSDDDSVEKLLVNYQDKLNIIYHKNNPALGTPRNWMAAFSYATGDWIKLIHDDDWFANPDALSRYVAAITPDCRYIFSGYNAYYENDNRYVDKTVAKAKFDHISKKPFRLLSGNIIGPPSVLMFHKSIKDYYEPELKWLVDIEYYISVLLKEKAIYINEPLINMSYNDSQVTNNCYNNPEIEIPEILFILKKYEHFNTKDIIVYDALWRSVRNNNIRSIEQMKHYSQAYPIPDFLRNIVTFQQNIPSYLLKIGLFSKIFMTISYTFNHKT